MRIPFSVGNFHFFDRGETDFWEGEQLQNWLASDHPRAYTSMPHPFFGATNVYYIYIICIYICYKYKSADQMYSLGLEIGRNQMYTILTLEFRLFLRIHLSYLKTGVLTPRQSQPRSCVLYSLQILVYSL